MKKLEIELSKDANPAHRDAVLRYAHHTEEVVDGNKVCIECEDHMVEEIKALDFVDKLSVDGSVVKEPEKKEEEVKPAVVEAPKVVSPNAVPTVLNDSSKPDKDVDISALTKETHDTVMDENTHTKPKR